MKFNEVVELDKKMEKSIGELLEKYPNIEPQALADTYKAGASDVLEILKDDTDISLALKDNKKYD